jgi:hypothetical protein
LIHLAAVIYDVKPGQLYISSQWGLVRVDSAAQKPLSAVFLPRMAGKYCLASAGSALYCRILRKIRTKTESVSDSKKTL